PFCLSGDTQFCAPWIDETFVVGTLRAGPPARRHGRETDQGADHGCRSDDPARRLDPPHGEAVRREGGRAPLPAEAACRGRAAGWAEPAADRDRWLRGSDPRRARATGGRAADGRGPAGPGAAGLRDACPRVWLYGELQERGAAYPAPLRASAGAGAEARGDAARSAGAARLVRGALPDRWCPGDALLPRGRAVAQPGALSVGERECGPAGVAHGARGALPSLRRGAALGPDR